MQDAWQNLGQRIVEVARLAVVLHQQEAFTRRGHLAKLGEAGGTGRPAGTRLSSTTLTEERQSPSGGHPEWPSHAEGRPE